MGRERPGAQDLDEGLPGHHPAEVGDAGSVLAHVRYPQDLFEVQRELLEQYHVDDPRQFYNVADKWTVPNDPTWTGTAAQPPYYVLASAARQPAAAPQFQLTTPMKVNNSTNLAAYITRQQRPGAELRQDDRAQGAQQHRHPGPGADRQHLQLQRRRSPRTSRCSTPAARQVIHGNLLTLPIGNSFLYVEPLYVQASGSTGYPILQRVLVAYGDKIGYAANLDRCAGQPQSSAGRASLLDRQQRPIDRRQSPTTTPSTGSYSPSTSPSRVRPARCHRPSVDRAPGQASPDPAEHRVESICSGLQERRPGKIGAAQAEVAAVDQGLPEQLAQSDVAQRIADGDPDLASCARPSRVGLSYRRGVEQLGSSLGS